MASRSVKEEHKMRCSLPPYMGWRYKLRVLYLASLVFIANIKKPRLLGDEKARESFKGMSPNLETSVQERYAIFLVDFSDCSSSHRRHPSWHCQVYALLDQRSKSAAPQTIFSSFFLLLTIARPLFILFYIGNTQFAAMVHRSDHFYTTDPSDKSKTGYRFEGITGYLFTGKFSNTIALHHWFNPASGDNFYTHEEPQIPSTNGYQYQGIVGYLYREPTRGTVPLLRWWHTISGDHFYTTNPRGEIAPMIGYIFEGITGYLFPEPTEGTTPLFRWYLGD
jgi:hypothetical protein